MMLSIVVPCYRSALTLATLVQRLDVVTQNLVHSGIIQRCEYIFVIDGSPDETANVARELQAETPFLEVIELSRNFGQHNALLAGITASTGDIIITMDDDLQHSPEDIPAMIASLESKNADVIYGVSTREEHGFVRSLSSRLAKAMFKTLGVTHGGDISAFRAFTRELVPLFNNVQSPVVSVDVVLSWGTKRISTCPVDMKLRETGSSGYNLISLSKYMMNVVLGFSTFPLKLATWVGAISSLLALIFGVYTLVMYFAQGISTEGFTTIAILIAFFGGVQLFSMGVLGEYLGRIFMKQIGQPPYNIRSVSSQKS
ncbi:MAG: glycosyltransferase family 2 protein [Aurantimicrobium sp.]|uniref:glycosyltransferase family 2 protein n=1 Tax=Aurantimicrobium sp. TaxID=1930784 RepID=UPI002FC7164D